MVILVVSASTHRVVNTEVERMSEDIEIESSEDEIVITPLAETYGEMAPLPPEPDNVRELPEVRSSQNAQKYMVERWNVILDILGSKEPAMKGDLERFRDNPPSWWRKWELYDYALPYAGEEVESRTAFDLFRERYGESAQLGSVALHLYPELLATHAGKAGTVATIKPTPGFTKIGANIAWPDWIAGIAPLIVGEDRWQSEFMRDSAYDSVNALGKAFGVLNGAWVGYDLIHLMAGTKSLEQGHSPIPDVYMEEGYQRMQRELGYPQLKPADLFVSSIPTLGGTSMSNFGAATGPPYTLMTRDEMADAGIKTSDGGAPRKGNIIRYDARDTLEWIDRGMEWPESDSVRDYITNIPTAKEDIILISNADGSVQETHAVVPSYQNPLLTPASAWFRSDTPFEYPWLATANRHRGLLAPWLPIRSVVIVPSKLTFMMGAYADPWSEWISAKRPNMFDLVDEPHATERVNSMVNLAMESADRGAVMIGVDFSRWDRFVTPQDHVWEARAHLDAYPEEVELLVGLSRYPVVPADADWIEKVRSETPLDRGVRGNRVPVTVQPSGSHPRVNTVPFMKRKVNFHDYILKIHSAVNSSPILFGDWAIEGRKHKLEIPGYPGRFITSMGGRRSGDKSTSNENSRSHVRDAYSVEAMSRDPAGRRLIAKRAGIPYDQVSEFSILDIMVRGDDGLWVMIPMKGWTAAQTFEIVARTLGKVANAAKQETSNVPGYVTVGYAATSADNSYPRRITLPGRPAARSYTGESASIPSYLRDGESHEVLVADTVEAKSRLMTLEGPFGRDTVPGWEKIVAFVADNDKYGLSYSHLSLTDEEYRNFIDREAKVWVKRLKATGISTASEEELYTQYKENNIHDLLRARALDYQDRKRPYTIPRRVDARILFDLMSKPENVENPFDVDWERLIAEAEIEAVRRLDESSAAKEYERELAQDVEDTATDEPMALAAETPDQVGGFDLSDPYVDDDIDG